MRYKLVLFFVALLCALTVSSVALAQDDGDSPDQIQRVFLPAVTSGGEVNVRAGTVDVTVTLLDHNGAPLGGGALEGYWSGSWHGCPGTTDGGTGKLTCTVDSSYTKLKMVYNFTAIEQDLAALVLTGNTWVTTQVVIELRDSANNLIMAADESSGGYVQMGSPNGGWNGKGWTGTDGKFEVEVFPTPPGGTPPWFKVDYRQGTMQKNDVPITANPVTPPIVFKTAKVTLFHSGNINIDKGGGGLYPFTKPSTELFPATWKFRFSSIASADIVVPAAGVSKLVNLLVLKDSTGAPINGNTSGRGGYGASFGTFFVTGPTVNNVTFDIRDSATQPGQMSYEKSVNSTTQVKGPQDVAVNSVFNFQTRLLTLRLETCTLAPLDGGTARWGNGANFGTNFFPAPNSTGSSAAGETAAQFFPGTYSFEMNYKGTAEVKSSVTIPDADTKLTWQTTKVTIQYSGAISFGGPTGQSQWFVKPSMELMPSGPHKFHFQSPEGGRLDFTWSGCEFTKSVFALNVKDSGGTGIAGATGDYYISTWLPIPGTTDSEGILPYALDGLKTNVHTKAILKGMLQQKPPQNIATNSVFVYQTIPVTFKLKAMDGTTDLAGGAQYYAGAWRDFGSGVTPPTNGTLTPATMEMLPLTNLSFGVRYLGAWQQKVQDITVNPDVVFQTGQVTSATCTKFYTTSWQTFTNGQEMLPVSTIFSDAGGPNTPATPVAGISTAVVCP